MPAEEVDILLVEDDPSDVDLTKEGLKESHKTVRLHVVEDGIKALQYLRQQGPYAGTVPPDLILLDLNLPKKDGREVLREIKSDSRLKHLPVVVLTSSDNPADVSKSYALGANCYITKPMDLDQFIGLVHAIEYFFGLRSSAFPRGEDDAGSESQGFAD